MYEGDETKRVAAIELRLTVDVNSFVGSNVGCDCAASGQ